MQHKFSFRKEYRGRTIFIILNTIFFIFIMACMLIPVLKVLSDSFDKNVSYGMNLFPKEFTLEGYKYIFKSRDLYLPFLISIQNTLLGTFVGLAIACIGAYILIQFDMPGVKIFSYMFMFTMIFNGGLLPTYLVIRDLGLLNTCWSVVLTIAMNVYNLVLMRNFFEQIPRSLFEAAEIDGCSPFGIFIRIVLPLSKPALASIGLFYAVAAWSEYFHYILYITDTAKYNFQVKLRSLIMDSESLSGDLDISINTVQNASIIVAILPFMFIYPFCQRYFISGVTMGAVKE